MYRNQYLFLSSCFTLVLCIPLCFTPQLLRVIGQESELVNLATQYIWTILPGIYLHNQGFVQQVYAESMKKTKVRIYVTAISSLVHLIAIFITVFLLEKSFEGVCLATSISLGSRFFIANFFVRRMEQTLDGDCEVVCFFSSDTFINLSPQIKLGIQSMGMHVWGYWALDLFMLMTSYLSMEALAA